MWGKPFVKAGTDLGCDSWLHNCWIERIDQKKFKNNIVILHLNQLYPERQKRVTLSKFISKGRVPQGTTLEQILTDGDLFEDKSEETKRLLSELGDFCTAAGPIGRIAEELFPRA